MKHPWKETAPGRVERGLDSSERFLKAVAIPFKPLGRENWALNIILNVSFGSEKETKDGVVPALREAWVKLRYHHPFIATDIQLEENKYKYSTPTEDVMEQWVLESFFVHEDISVDQFLIQAMWAEASSVHYFPQSSEILLRTHHWLIDGIGGLHLANRFLELYAEGAAVPNPQFGDEIKNLPPSLFDAAGFPENATGPGVVQKAQAKFMDFASNLPSIGLPVEASPMGPGGTIRKHISFAQDKLEALLAACRAKNITIAVAVHAALAVVTQEKAYQSALAKNFTTVAFFDYRKYLPAPYNDTRQYPMGV
ncbi:hypothetical protein BU24DRAFT_429078 [Aaosphaeria arxii CBS 175.79]|uniref:Condensation domain-containing protein n=1 Tax=Aaosphaeria arxii CBS 175.79 TaxID=1450172 RepID=A0A6A5X737_9PLEO|nr:uncharacterized protein BU24DRAFT_429078 [Aaosphaeria arxii CBS 175.79]KAF2008773.1 hypothetical protein BU24DRAFT_429078 [Aaosphaeria arxii CBS 175.79]